MAVSNCGSTESDPLSATSTLSSLGHHADVFMPSIRRIPPPPPPPPSSRPYAQPPRRAAAPPPPPPLPQSPRPTHSQTGLATTATASRGPASGPPSTPTPAVSALSSPPSPQHQQQQPPKPHRTNEPRQPPFRQEAKSSAERLEANRATVPPPVPCERPQPSPVHRACRSTDFIELSRASIDADINVPKEPSSLQTVTVRNLTTDRPLPPLPRHVKPRPRPGAPVAEQQPSDAMQQPDAERSRSRDRGPAPSDPNAPLDPTRGGPVGALTRTDCVFVKAYIRTLSDLRGDPEVYANEEARLPSAGANHDSRTQDKELSCGELVVDANAEQKGDRDTNAGEGTEPVAVIGAVRHNQRPAHLGAKPRRKPTLAPFGNAKEAPAHAAPKDTENCTPPRGERGNRPRDYAQPGHQDTTRLPFKERARRVVTGIAVGRAGKQQHSRGGGRSESPTRVSSSIEDVADAHSTPRTTQDVAMLRAREIVQHCALQMNDDDAPTMGDAGGPAVDLVELSAELRSCRAAHRLLLGALSFDEAAGLIATGVSVDCAQDDVLATWLTADAALRSCVRQHRKHLQALNLAENVADMLAGALRATERAAAAASREAATPTTLAKRVADKVGPTKKQRAQKKKTSFREETVDDDGWDVEFDMNDDDDDAEMYARRARRARGQNHERAPHNTEIGKSRSGHMPASKPNRFWADARDKVTRASVIISRLARYDEELMIVQQSRGATSSDSTSLPPLKAASRMLATPLSVAVARAPAPSVASSTSSAASSSLAEQEAVAAVHEDVRVALVETRDAALQSVRRVRDNLTNAAHETIRVRHRKILADNALIRTRCALVDHALDTLESDPTSLRIIFEVHELIKAQLEHVGA